MASWVVKNTGQFLRKIAIDYVRYGYIRYMVLKIPQGKDVEQIDQKIALAYDITSNHKIRERRRRQGLANVVYVRYRQMFVLLATEGQHPVFDPLKWSDIRTTPLRYGCYSIGLTKKGKVSIRLILKSYRAIKKTAMRMALQPAEKIEKFLAKAFVLPFNGVAVQRDKLIKNINNKRGRHRLKKLEVNKPEKKYPLCLTKKTDQTKTYNDQSSSSNS